jgi:hypothetical protein
MYLSITHEALNFIFSSFFGKSPVFFGFKYTSSFWTAHKLISIRVLFQKKKREKKNHCLYGVHNAVICYVFEWIIMRQKTNTLHRNGIFSLKCESFVSWIKRHQINLIKKRENILHKISIKIKCVMKIYRWIN